MCADAQRKFSFELKKEEELHISYLHLTRAMFCFTFSTSVHPFIYHKIIGLLKISFVFLYSLDVFVYKY